MRQILPSNQSVCIRLLHFVSFRNFSSSDIPYCGMHSIFFSAHMGTIYTAPTLLFYLCIFINNPVISIPSAVTLRSWSISAKFPLLFPYIFFLLIFYPPIVPSRNTRLRFMISIISSCMLRISSGFILERRSRTASTFGILPLIQFFSLFDMLSVVFIF